MKRTPLYENHLAAGGKMIDFGGWEMPVQYGSILQEHRTVRMAAGLFDVSHMGEILVTGRDAEEYLQLVLTNDISKAKEGQAVYSPMCYPTGGVVDDLLVYKYNSFKYLLVVNASNTEKDYLWLKEHVKGEVLLDNISDEYGQLALQGPLAEKILQSLTETDLAGIKFFNFKDEVNLQGIKGLVSRSGYTGEDGFEIYMPAAEAPLLWEKILQAGKNEDIKPAGLGARDTLRFEAALPLYGQEIDQSISPLEARLGIFVKFDKGNFIGRQALLEQKEKGLSRKLIGIEMLERGVPRHGYKLQFKGEDVGVITTGTFSPSLNKNLGMALVNSEYASIGNMLDVVIREKAIKCQVVKLPFYAKKYVK